MAPTGGLFVVREGERAPGMDSLIVASDDCLRGGGEAGALMRNLDWSSTPLGPVELWPPSLRTIVAVMLSSRFAMRVLWGPEFIVLYNDAYRPILGETKHPAAMGSPASTIFAEVWELVGPVFQRVRRGDAVAFDDALLPLDRNGYLEDCYFTVSYSPIRDEYGSVGGVLGVVHETTDRVLAERRLATLRDLAGCSTPDATPEQACRQASLALERNRADVPSTLLYLVDEDGRRARRVDATDLCDDGLPAPESVELDPAAVAPWPLGRAASEGRCLVVGDLPRRPGELTEGSAAVLPLTRPGRERAVGFLVARINPRLAFDDRYRGFLELAAERIASALATALARQEERRSASASAALSAKLTQLEAALEEALLVKDEFLSTMNHELRTPLNAILGWTRMIRSGRVAVDQQKHALETIERNAVAETRLIEDLLDVSRMTSGSLRLDVAPVDLAGVLGAAVEAMRPSAEARRIRLQVKLDPHEGAVLGDRERLQQVVSSLLSNAVKFSHPEGKVEVTLERADRSARLTVRDHGEGIAPGFLPFVFGHFRQGDQSITRRHGGAGLGLAIARHLVELHGGAITAESEGEGRGATFTVSIPFGRRG